MSSVLERLWSNQTSSAISDEYIFLANAEKQNQNLSMDVYHGRRPFTTPSKDDSQRNTMHHFTPPSRLSHTDRDVSVATIESQKDFTVLPIPLKERDSEQHKFSQNFMPSDDLDLIEADLNHEVKQYHAQQNTRQTMVQQLSILRDARLSVGVEITALENELHSEAEAIRVLQKQRETLEQRLMVVRQEKDQVHSDTNRISEEVLAIELDIQKINQHGIKLQEQKNKVENMKLDAAKQEIAIAQEMQSFFDLENKINSAIIEKRSSLQRLIEECRSKANVLLQLQKDAQAKSENLQALHADIKRVHKESESVQGQYESLLSSLESEKSKVKQREHECREVKASITKLQKEVAALQDNKQSLHETNSKLKLEKQDVENRLRRISLETEDAKRDLQQMSSALQSKKLENEQILRDLGFIEREKSEVESVLRRTKQEEETQRVAIQEKSTELQSIKRTLETLSTEYDDSCSQLMIAHENKKKLVSNILELQRQQVEWKQYQDQLQATQNAVDDGRLNLAEIHGIVMKLASEADSIKSEIAREQVKRLEIEREIEVSGAGLALAKTQVETTQVDIERLEIQRQEVSAHFGQLSAQKDSMNKRLNELLDRQKELAAQVEKATIFENQLRTKIHEDEDHLKNLTIQVQEKHEYSKELADRAVTLRNRIRGSDEDIKQLESHITELLELEKAAQTEIESKMLQIEQIKEMLQESVDQLKIAKESERSVLEIFERTASEQDGLVKNITKIRDQISAMNVSTQNMNEEKRSLQSKIVESETVAKAEEKQLLQAKQKVRHLEEESESRMESLRLLNQRLVELQVYLLALIMWFYL